MSFNIDEKEFYETFAEITQDLGLEEAKRWAWPALDWTQQELQKEGKSNEVDGEAYNMGRSEGQADIAASLSLILDPEDKNHWNIIGLLKEVVRLSGERAAVVAWLRERADTAYTRDASGELRQAAYTIERGGHRSEEGE